MELTKLTYSVSETAKLLNVSTYLVYEAVRHGKLKVIHFGRRIIVPANSIRRLLGISESEKVTSQITAKGHETSQSIES